MMIGWAMGDGGATLPTLTASPTVSRVGVLLVTRQVLQAVIARTGWGYSGTPSLPHSHVTLPHHSHPHTFGLIPASLAPILMIVTPCPQAADPSPEQAPIPSR